MPARVSTTVLARPMPGGRRRMSTLPPDQPVKKQSKWSPEEDASIIELRGSGMKWEDISKRLPGRSAISCRLHYQNYLERRSEWDEDRKNKLARLYERFKADMWAKVAEELAVPWRAAEAMHWQLGEAEMARRAGVVPFSLAAVNVESAHRASPSRASVQPQSHINTIRDIPIPMSPRTIYGRPTSMSSMPRSRAMISRQDIMPRPIPQPQGHLPPPPPPPLPMAHESGEIYYGPGPGLPPIQNQPSPRNQGFLPSVAELTTGVSPYMTAPGPPNTAPPGTPAMLGPGQHYDMAGGPGTEVARPKRRASSDAGQHDTGHRRRMG